ncbi:thymidine phosphorylase [Sulfobacillus thermosulfidooxidans]|uniref:thymidine phosphorylase n=1 Tax=Sulfobacillus thermosulfidooxidans TaxID=28034 RepID=UPI001FA74955|nr:thymidine phosphorylase [Sulfobacillus thermosulfidooxidans]
MKTRDGHALTPLEIQDLVNGIVDQSWPDYQLAAWLMAVYCRGLTEDEIFALTGAMAFTGAPLLEPLGIVDKHSTGGVGDKTTLVLAPVMAALGFPMAKMSGRGLGHTGGTLDKLESIPGFRTELTIQELRQQIDNIGVAVVAQSAQLAPADKRLYALRDVTGTVDSIPLIASSVMSKKLAAGTKHLVLDVKVGNGAFMAHVEEAMQLAQLMVKIGQHHHRRVSAILTTMNQPLGFAVGNAIEVNEAALCLQGQGPEDLHEEVVTLATELVHLVTKESLTEARKQVLAVLDQGKAWDMFGRWIDAQGGEFHAVAKGLPLAPVVLVWEAQDEGTVRAMDTRKIGDVALNLGAGRHRLEDHVDPAVGLMCYAKIGRRFEPGEVVAEVFARSKESAEEALRNLKSAISWGEPTETDAHLVLGTVRPDF